MRLELSAFVKTDLDEIAAFIADDNPGRAVTFIQDIRAKFRVIQGQHPRSRKRQQSGCYALCAPSLGLGLPGLELPLPAAAHDHATSR